MQDVSSRNTVTDESLAKVLAATADLNGFAQRLLNGIGAYDAVEILAALTIVQETFRQGVVGVSPRLGSAAVILAGCAQETMAQAGEGER